MHVHPFIPGGAGIVREDSDRILKTLGLGESARLLKELTIHSIRWTSRTLEICRPYLTSPAELACTSGATGGSFGGGLTADAGDGSSASGSSAGQNASGAHPSAPGFLSAAATPGTVPLHVLPPLCSATRVAASGPLLQHKH